MMKGLILFITILISYSVFSQDSTQIYSLLQQSREALKKSNVTQALQLAHQSLSLSSQKQNHKGIAFASNQLAFIFETPILITNVFSIFKTKAELINSKIIALNIFKNLTNAPQSIIKSLDTSSTDVFLSILRLLIRPK